MYSPECSHAYCFLMGWKNIMSISIPHARTHYGKILLLCLSLVCFCTHGFAGGYNHSTFTDPALRDLPKRIDLAQAYRLKSEYERELINTADTSDKNTINEQSFLKALVKHSDYESKKHKAKSIIWQLTKPIATLSL